MLYFKIKSPLKQADDDVSIPPNLVMDTGLRVRPGPASSDPRPARSVPIGHQADRKPAVSQNLQVVRTSPLRTQ